MQLAQLQKELDAMHMERQAMMAALQVRADLAASA